MSLEIRPTRVVESIDRRVVAAFQLVDAATQLPLAAPAAVSAPRALVAGNPDEVTLPANAVRMQRNRSGMHVLLAAPFFDTYTSTFSDPQPPPETAGGPLTLRVAVTDAGPQHLPRQFRLALPRSLNPADADSVFEPLVVPLFRAPGAPVQEGWTVLRVVVTGAGNPDERLPGVLVRVFRRPQADGDLPIAAGMTDWRGRVRGEALIPVTVIPRFRPGAGPHVIERDQEIELEATRDSGFTGADGELPDVARLTEGTGGGVTRVSTRAPDPQLTVVRPATPVRVQAGREYVVHLSMP